LKRGKGKSFAGIIIWKSFDGIKSFRVWCYFNYDNANLIEYLSGRVAALDCNGNWKKARRRLWKASRIPS
jgi:hypothetical protein